MNLWHNCIIQLVFRNALWQQLQCPVLILIIIVSITIATILKRTTKCKYLKDCRIHPAEYISIVLILQEIETATVSNRCRSSRLLERSRAARFESVSRHGSLPSLQQMQVALDYREANDLQDRAGQDRRTLWIHEQRNNRRGDLQTRSRLRASRWSPISLSVSQQSPFFAATRSTEYTRRGWKIGTERNNASCVRAHS